MHLATFVIPYNLEEKKRNIRKISYIYMIGMPSGNTVLEEKY